MESGIYAGEDGLALAELIRGRKVSVREVVEAALARIAELNPRLNAVVALYPEEALAVADRLDREGEPSGPLWGVPLLLKNAGGEVRGWRTDLSSTLLAGLPPSAVDSAQVARLKQAGMVPLGKTNVPEWGIVPTTEPTMYGPTVNPWGEGLAVGGSSGGSAAAVAAGFTPVAHGNDAGGSLRLPAALCGVVGLKPSRGRITLAPYFGELHGGLFGEHVLTRSVRDSAAALDATAGPAPGDPYAAPPAPASYLALLEQPTPRLKVAWSDGAFLTAAVEPPCQAAVQGAAAALAGLGHQVAPAAPALDPAFTRQALENAFLPCLAFGIDATCQQTQGRPAAEADLEPFSWWLLQKGRALPGAASQLAAFQRHAVGRVMGAFHQDWDLWVTPVWPVEKLPLGRFTVEPSGFPALWDETLRLVGISCLANLTGQPAVSLPLGLSPAGLPQGVMLTAAYGREDLLCQVAADLERVMPWAGRLPRVPGA
ncbi:MAG: amidase [Deltaproteobacteria bacterium]|nr:amidase [Deltaproteobacteria bacterium]